MCRGCGDRRRHQGAAATRPATSKSRANAQMGNRKRNALYLLCARLHSLHLCSPARPDVRSQCQSGARVLREGRPQRSNGARATIDRCASRARNSRGNRAAQGWDACWSGMEKRMLAMLCRTAQCWRSGGAATSVKCCHAWATFDGLRSSRGGYDTTLVKVDHCVFCPRQPAQKQHNPAKKRGPTHQPHLLEDTTKNNPISADALLKASATPRVTGALATQVLVTSGDGCHVDGDAPAAKIRALKAVHRCLIDPTFLPGAQ